MREEKESNRCSHVVTYGIRVHVVSEQKRPHVVVGHPPSSTGQEVIEEVVEVLLEVLLHCTLGRGREGGGGRGEGMCQYIEQNSGQGEGGRM